MNNKEMETIIIKLAVLQAAIMANADAPDDDLPETWQAVKDEWSAVKLIIEDYIVKLESPVIIRKCIVCGTKFNESQELVDRDWWPVCSVEHLNQSNIASLTDEIKEKKRDLKESRAALEDSDDFAELGNVEYLKEEIKELKKELKKLNGRN
jgi:hypothetical protein